MLQLAANKHAQPTLLQGVQASHWQPIKPSPDFACNTGKARDIAGKRLEALAPFCITTLSTSHQTGVSAHTTPPHQGAAASHWQNFHQAA